MNFETIGIALLVEFVTNKITLLLYSAIPDVANQIKSLGAQKEDGRQWLASFVYLITNNSMKFAGKSPLSRALFAGHDVLDLELNLQT